MPRPKKADGDSYISQTPDAKGFYHAVVSMGPGPDGKNDRRHIMRKDRAAVVAKVRALEQARDAGKVPKKGKRPTVKDMIERHLTVTLPARNRAPKTIYSYRSTAENHIYPRWGHVRVDRLRDDQIEEGIADMLAAGYEPAGVRKVLAILSSAYVLMVKRGEVARNPCITVDPPELGPSKQKALTEPQARLVVQTAMGRPNARRWEVGLSMGLRQGEALGLRWEYLSVDVPAGEVGEMRVWWQLQRLPWTHGCADPAVCAEPWHKRPCPKRCPKKRASGRPHTCTPVGAKGLCKPGCVKHAAQCPQRKDGGLVFRQIKEKGRKTIPIPPELCVGLREHRNAQYLQRVTLGDDWEDHDLVFSQWNGKPVDPRSDWQEWTDILAAVGIDHVGVHAARHSAATLALELGIALPVVQEMLGHSDIRVTRGYQHVSSALSKDAARRMGRLSRDPETDSHGAV